MTKFEVVFFQRKIRNVSYIGRFLTSKRIKQRAPYSTPKIVYILRKQEIYSYELLRRKFQMSIDFFKLVNSSLTTTTNKIP